MRTRRIGVTSVPPIFCGRNKIISLGHIRPREFVVFLRLFTSLFSALQNRLRPPAHHVLLWNMEMVSPPAALAVNKRAINF